MNFLFIGKIVRFFDIIEIIDGKVLGTGWFSLTYKYLLEFVLTNFSSDDYAIIYCISTATVIAAVLTALLFAFVQDSIHAIEFLFSFVKIITFFIIFVKVERILQRSDKFCILFFMVEGYIAKRNVYWLKYRIHCFLNPRVVLRVY